MTPWFPPATVCADVERANDGLQVPLPPTLVETEAQDTVTAETGTVGQLAKLEEVAWSVRLQAPVLKSRFVQLIEVDALPESTGDVSGFVALKVTVAGVTVRLKSAAAFALDVTALRRLLGSRGDTGRIAPGGPTAASNIVMESQAPIDSLD